MDEKLCKPVLENDSRESFLSSRAVGEKGKASIDGKIYKDKTN